MGTSVSGSNHWIGTSRKRNGPFSTHTQVLYIPCAVHGHDSATRVTLLDVALCKRSFKIRTPKITQFLGFLLLRYLRHIFTSGIVGSFVGERSNTVREGEGKKLKR
jgi:hypothetical protein